MNYEEIALDILEQTRYGRTATHHLEAVSLYAEVKYVYNTRTNVLAVSASNGKDFTCNATCDDLAHCIEVLLHELKVATLLTEAVAALKEEAGSIDRVVLGEVVQRMVQRGYKTSYREMDYFAVLAWREELRTVSELPPIGVQGINYPAKQCRRCDGLYPINKGTAHFCRSCAGVVLRTCIECGAHTPDFRTVNYKQYCVDCFEQRDYCSDCGESFHESALEEGLCCDCRVTCYDCDEVIAISDSFTDRHIYLCDSCHDNYYTCNDCGRFVLDGDAVDDGGNWLCTRCYGRDSIDAYNYKPRPVFFPEKQVGGLYLGVEIEMDKGGESPRKAAELLKIINHDKKRAYIKKDGSLNNGFELVSHPATLQAHINDFRWKATFNKAVAEGYRSHDTSTCGLHVHVSRDGLGADPVEQEETIMKILFIVERTWTEFVDFSRRTEEQISRWAKRYGLQPPKRLLDTAKGVNERHTCINLKPSQTIEFRFFRGTLNYDTFLATLQMVQYICDFAKHNSLETITDVTWDSFIGGAVKYPELKTYLIKRDLLDDRWVNEIESPINLIIRDISELSCDHVENNNNLRRAI